MVDVSLQQDTHVALNSRTYVNLTGGNGGPAMLSLGRRGPEYSSKAAICAVFDELLTLRVSSRRPRMERSYLLYSEDSCTRCPHRHFKASCGDRPVTDINVRSMCHDGTQQQSHVMHEGPGSSACRGPRDKVLRSVGSTCGPWILDVNICSAHSTPCRVERRSPLGRFWPRGGARRGLMGREKWAGEERGQWASLTIQARAPVTRSEA